MTTPPPTSFEFFPAGQPAPAFRLEAIKSRRMVSPQDCTGRPLGLVFHGRETLQAVVDINTTVRPEFPEPDQLTLASVLDMSIVPRLMQRAVKPLLENAYNQAASHIPQSYNPADYVFLLPDWDGKVTKLFRVKHPDKMAAIVVLGAQGIVVGSYQGPEPGPATLELVRRASEKS